MIQLDHVYKTYGSGESSVHALDDVCLSIPRHQFAAIMGPSGCGKSTLLNLLGTLDAPSSGTISVDGVDLHHANEQDATAFRREKLGFVFQFFHLMPTMNVLENASLPLMLAGRRESEAREAARDMLEMVGLSHRLHHLPRQLSGGEMQRTAVARALAHHPALVLADEPTGNLDSENAAHILDLLASIPEQGLSTVLMVTHAEQVAKRASRIIRMRDGTILSDSASPGYS